jgi:diamine N-acetyltransferase
MSNHADHSSTREGAAAMHIRDVVTGEGARLAALAERTFRDTFTKDNTANDMDLHCATHYNEATQEAELRDSSRRTMVVERDGEWLAYAQLRFDADGSAEIIRFYVDAPWHGQGIAGTLMQHAITRATSAGAPHITLGVFERNARAISFYKKWGFVEHGEAIFTVGTDPQRDLVLIRVAAAL